MTIWASTGGSEEGRRRSTNGRPRPKVRQGRDREALAALLPLAANQARLRLAGLSGSRGRSGMALRKSGKRALDEAVGKLDRPAARQRDEPADRMKPEDASGGHRQGHGGRHRAGGPMGQVRSADPAARPAAASDRGLRDRPRLDAGRRHERTRGHRTGGLRRGDFGRDPSSSRSGTTPNGWSRPALGAARSATPAP